MQAMLVQVMPDDHSKSVPPLPIPNRTVKRLCADDSAATSVKVGYRQASYREKTPAEMLGFFFALPPKAMTVFRPMEYQQLLAWRRSHPAWRLLLADHAPMIASFLHQAFIVTNARGLPREQLASQLDDHLFALHRAAGETLFPKAAAAYLDDWASDARGWLRKYYPAGIEEAHYDLTPATTVALRWMGLLEHRMFTGTEARLATVRQLLNEVADRTELSPRARVAQLRERKADIDAEIARIEQGRLELLEPAQVRERFALATDIAADLLLDMRAVEQNFLSTARAVHERIAAGDGPSVGPASITASAIDETDEAVSFRAFHKSITSPASQVELAGLLERAVALDPVREMAAERRALRLPHHLSEGANGAHETASRLSRQLRRHLDDRARLESRRLMQLVRSIKQKALSVRETPPDSWFIDIDEPSPTLGLPMDRTLFSPPIKRRLRQPPAQDAPQAEIPAGSLFSQAHVDQLRLAANLREALQTRAQVSLSEVVALFPLRHGLAELAAYLELAAHDVHCAIDEARTELVQWAGPGGNMLQASLPLVIYTIGASPHP
jgi:hypothetical protein